VTVQIVRPVAAAVAGGLQAAHQIVVRLDPSELGRVEVRLQTDPRSGASVQVNVERPATLTLLRHDEAGLHRALDQAGVPSSGRSLSLQLGGSWSGGASGQDRGGSGTRGNASASAAGSRLPAIPDEPAPASALTRVRTALNLGLDITA
jgi:flagellar hook-length control protein FliK